MTFNITRKILERRHVHHPTGFDNYHKIAVRDHVHTPKFWRM